MDYSIFLISHQPETGPVLQRSLYPEELNFFDGRGYPSFSKLVNSVIASSTTETIIITSHKARPSSEHVHKMVNLLNSGYGFVALHRFAFFGFKKELFRRIGMFDERYVGGGFEDYDLIVRLIEANIAAFITLEAPYIPAPSSWNYMSAYPHWCTKWKHYWREGDNIPYKLERTMPEETYEYDLGPAVPVQYLSCKEHSYIEYCPHASPFFSMEIT